MFMFDVLSYIISEDDIYTNLFLKLLILKDFLIFLESLLFFKEFKYIETDY